MPRLIDADALMKDIDSDIFNTESRRCYEKMRVRKQPTIDAEPVRLRVEKADIVESNGWYRKRFYCSCGQLIRTEAWDEKRCFGEGTILKENVMPRFCPNCGAKMTEVQDD